MKEVQFRQPVYVGDIVSFYTDVERLGNTSITVRVTVRAERYRSPGSDVLVPTDAEVVYVGVDENFNKVPIRRPADPA
jgi:acyl-CoA thioesterase YciA